MIGSRCLVILSLLVAFAAKAAAAEALAVRSDFPGGSVSVEKIDPAARSVRFIPGGDPDRGWACWWYFKVEGLVPGTTLTLDLGGTGWGQPDQAFFSFDNRSWQQTAPGTRGNRRIVYRIPVSAREAWFAWGPPFRLQEATDFIANLCRSSRDASAFDLARTRENRPVPVVKILQRDVAETDCAAIWVQARQHAWEVGSSWVARGLAEWLTSGEPAAVALRRRAAVYIVPIVDVDNVERGAGGKNQKPHDQNWDWGDAPYFPEVGAAMARVGALERSGRLAAFFDLHNPGTTNRHILFYLPAQPLLPPERVASQERFFKIAREETAGPIGFAGELGPCGATYDPAVDRTSESWTAHQARAGLLSLTWETPWNTPTSTAAGYLQTGAQLGRSIERYLREKP